jgi:hypothetical protein
MQIRKINRVTCVHPKHLRERGSKTRYACPLKRRVQKRGRYE